MLTLIQHGNDSAQSEIELQQFAGTAAGEKQTKKQKTKTKKEKEDVKASLICHSLFFYVHAQAHKFCEAVRCRKLFALYVAQTKFSNLSIFIRGEVLWVFY